MATTLIEAMVIIFTTFALMIAALLMLMSLATKTKTAQKINCVSNLKEVYLGSLVWAGDNNDKFPFEISVTNGGTMEYAQEGDVIKTFQIMSNQLATPKILFCTVETNGTYATNFLNDSGLCTSQRKG